MTEYSIIYFIHQITVFILILQGPESVDDTLSKKMRRAILMIVVLLVQHLFLLNKFMRML